MNKISKGESITISDLSQRIRDSFREQFDPTFMMGMWIVSIFKDFIIVACADMDAGSYCKVTYTVSADNVITFQAQADWQTVEIDYVPSMSDTSQMSTSTTNGMTDSKKAVKKKFVETKISNIKIKGHSITAEGITANIVNGNNRIYPKPVLREAVNILQDTITKSNGQGRVIGLAEHPSKLYPNGEINKVVIKWTSASFNESTSKVDLTGDLLPTTLGNDLMVLNEAGIPIPLSQRAYGTSEIDAKTGVEVITSLEIAGYDAVFDPSDPNAKITDILESTRNIEMTKEELLKLITDNPDLFKDLFKTVEVSKVPPEQIGLIESIVRTQLRINETDDVAAKIKEMRDAVKAQSDAKKATDIKAAIVEATKDVNFGVLTQSFTDSVEHQPFTSVEAVKPFVEAKKVEFSSIVAAAKLGNMGFNSGSSNVGAVPTQIETKPIFESYTGQPEFTKSSFLLQEAMHARGYNRKVDYANPKNQLEEMAAKWVKRYDIDHQHQLIAESRLIAEASTTVDIPTPYTAMRTIYLELFPKSVALAVFNVGQMKNNPERIFFETFTKETGELLTVPATAINAFVPAWTPPAIGVWQALPLYNSAGISSVIPGTVVFNGFVEGTDFVIDAYNGRVYTITAGFAAAAGATTLTLQFNAFARGEMLPIERVKQVLTYRDITATASRLAIEVSDEAIRFPRVQLGYDTVARALDGASKFMARNLDKQMFYYALAQLRTVATNTVTYSKANAIDSQTVGFSVQAGQARLKVKKRYYDEDLVKLVVDADLYELMSNSLLFQAANSRPDFTMAGINGHVGFWKGMPVYNSTEAPSDAMVVHPDLMYYRSFAALEVEGPFPTYASSGDVSRLVDAKQWLMRQYDSMDVLRGNAGSVVLITA